eukprot:TRINITY_DN16143_c0_g1_i1.p1 TRINITY_DN16143_c0_g1~~TRINITY_DN16143_c0_g1_i1.p1  ORF type:complete len:224 (+),score=52.57 TRINITY_DN16143_c0_g1_i1:42-713(+)
MPRFARYFERLNPDFAPAAPGPRPRVVFFGDSDIEHWRDEGAFPDWGVFVGVNGALMSDVADYAPRMVEKYEPEVVVAVAGENDMAQAYPHLPKKKGASANPEFPPTPIADFQRLFDTVVAKHRIPLVFLGCKPEPATKDLWKQYRMYDREVQCVFAEHARAAAPTPCLFLDNSNLSAGKYYAYDGLHLGRAGYDVWNFDVVDALKRVGSARDPPFVFNFAPP